MRVSEGPSAGDGRAFKDTERWRKIRRWADIPGPACDKVTDRRPDGFISPNLPFTVAYYRPFYRCRKPYRSMPNPGVLFRRQSPICHSRPGCRTNPHVKIT